MKKFDRFLVFVVIVVVIGFCFRGHFNNGKKDESKEVPEQKLEVSVAPIEAKDFALPSSYIGYAQEFKGLDIKPNISGFLTDVKVEGGDYVKKGDELFVIDNRTYIAAVNDAKASLNKTKADLDNATSYYERIKNTKEGAVSQSQRDSAKASFLEAQGSYNQALAQLKTAQVNLDYTVLTAPNDGYLGDVSVNVGDYVSPQTSLAYLLKYSPMKIVFSIPQADFVKFQQEKFSESWIKLKRRDKSEFKNKVLKLFTDNQFNQDTSSVPIYLRVENTQKNFLPGSYVNVVVEKPIKNGIVVDKDKLVLEPHGNFVYILKDGIITKTPVELGGYLEFQYYISNGLKGGDLLITTPVRPSQVGKHAEVKK
ncbi:MAG: efflux RND transporter periplasmic adaptor subunit [Alphaproteobacteria bacterium]